MGVSQRAYARHRGVSETAVRKAIRDGRIQKESDGTIDIDKADVAWSRNTDRSQQRSSSNSTSQVNQHTTKKAVPKEALDAVSDTLKENHSPQSGTTYMQARTANEVLKAQTNRVKLQQLKNELVDRNKALAHVFRLARGERDSWLGWPSRISAQMAAELEVDPHKMHVALESYVRQHLSELADLKPRVD